MHLVRNQGHLPVRDRVWSLPLTGSPGYSGIEFLIHTLGVRQSRVSMKGFAGQGQVRLAHRFVLGRMGVNQRRDIAGQRLPVVDQLGLADLFPHAASHHVDADHRTVGALHELDESRGGQDLALAVTAQVVLVGDDPVRSVLLTPPV